MNAVAARADASTDAAVSDAANDARGEVTKVKGVTKATAAKAIKNGYYHFIVDIWITDLNATEFGVYKHTRNRAKSRQFTSDMDIFADVTEGGERTGLIGYREDTWKKGEANDKRLVFKLFTDNLNWRATMDLMIGRSLQSTIAARGEPVMVFSINTDQDDFVVYLERSANKWPFLPEHFGFFIPDADGQPIFYRLKRDFINLGGDYTLYDQQGKKIGHLDGKVFSIGGKWKGKVKVEHADRRLLTVLQFFSAMQVFNGDCRRYMRRLWRDIVKGKVKPKLDAQELDLYKNPRRVR
ncbi:hypothetical protein [Hyphomicrobium sp. NDB2Meth4]|uniref:hypothetical protein n=1 Tax=Hyphomicrobium sp. NDB2Meth4 TaxID=1892846 RepID=UPI00093128E6|nr:hypothetical protein [Hyphomicrobium sp. NDB2Meth4]